MIVEPPMDENSKKIRERVLNIYSLDGVGTATSLQPERMTLEDVLQEFVILGAPVLQLTEAMRAEKDIRIRNRMMAVMGVLKGHSTKTASDFADVDRRTVQLWVARFNEGGIGGLRDAPGRGRASRARYGRIRKLADRLGG